MSVEKTVFAAYAPPVPTAIVRANSEQTFANVVDRPNLPNILSSSERGGQ